jgi:elongation factor Tu
MGALDACPTPLRSPDAPLRFPVFRAYRIAGRGTVATGVLARGRIADGDRVRVVGARRSWFNRRVAITAFDSEVLSLRELDQPRSHAEAGAAIGALLRPRAGGDSYAAYEICHGVTIVGCGVEGAGGAARFAGRFRFLGPSNATHRAGAAYLFYAGMAREAGTLELASDRRIHAGDVVSAVVALAMPMYLEVGMRLFVRRDQIVALGDVTSLAP